MSRALLELRAVSKRFAARRDLLGRPRAFVRALDEVSIVLERGERLALVGESGSGKSTLARLVTGLTRPDTGSLRFDGTELAALSPRDWRQMRRRVQMIFQDPLASLDPRWTVESIIAEPLVIHGLGDAGERTRRVRELLLAVGLSATLATRFPHELSGGQRQRVAIARALALEPEMLVCDEPVASLDVSLRAQVLNLLAELSRRRGISLLFVSHDLAAVRQLCTRVAVLYLGRLIEVAPVDELFAKPRHPYTEALLAAAPSLVPGARSAALAGESPDPHAPPSGCAFHPRCRYRQRVAEDACRTLRPELSVHGPSLAACHLDVLDP